MFTLARKDAIEERSAWIPPAEQLLRGSHQPGLANPLRLAYLNGRNIFGCEFSIKT
jgi:hypothetical protein